MQHQRRSSGSRALPVPRHAVRQTRRPAEAPPTKERSDSTRSSQPSSSRSKGCQSWAVELCRSSGDARSRPEGERDRLRTAGWTNMRRKVGRSERGPATQSRGSGVADAPDIFDRRRAASPCGVHVLEQEPQCLRGRPRTSGGANSFLMRISASRTIGPLSRAIVRCRTGCAGYRS